MSTVNPENTFAEVVDFIDRAMLVASNGRVSSATHDSRGLHDTINRCRSLHDQLVNRKHANIFVMNIDARRELLTAWHASSIDHDFTIVHCKSTCSITTTQVRNWISQLRANAKQLPSVEIISVEADELVTTIEQLLTQRSNPKTLIISGDPGFATQSTVDRWMQHATLIHSNSTSSTIWSVQEQKIETGLEPWKKIAIQALKNGDVTSVVSKILQEKPHSSQAEQFCELGVLFAHANLLEQAYASFEKALNYNPVHQDSLQNVTLLAPFMNKADEAKSAAALLFRVSNGAIDLRNKTTQPDHQSAAPSSQHRKIEHHENNKPISVRGKRVLVLQDNTEIIDALLNNFARVTIATKTSYISTKWSELPHIIRTIQLNDPNSFRHTEYDYFAVEQATPLDQIDHTQPNHQLPLLYHHSNQFYQFAQVAE